MPKLALTFAALAAAATLACAPPALAQSGDAAIRLAQADVSIRVNTPSTQRTVVKKKVVVRPAVKSKTVVRTAGSNCRTVTVRKRVNNKTVISKTRRCS